MCPVVVLNLPFDITKVLNWIFLFFKAAEVEVEVEVEVEDRL